MSDFICLLHQMPQVAVCPRRYAMTSRFALSLAMIICGGAFNLLLFVS